MNQKIKYGLIFVAGSVIGGLATYLIMRNKFPIIEYVDISNYPDHPQTPDNNEPIEDNLGEEERQELANAAKNKPNIFDYANAYAPQKSIEYPDTEVELEAQEVEESDEQNYLYEITLSEFSNYTNDRTRVTLFWYEDDVFTDEVNQKIDPREYLDGYLKLLDDNTPIDPIDYIRKMAKDEICIRNFEKNLDIDICSQGITYADYMSID